LFRSEFRPGFTGAFLFEAPESCGLREGMDSVRKLDTTD
jgi:hypothetical protein